jgi:hypothetical protein
LFKKVREYDFWMGMEQLMSKLKVETAEEGDQWSKDRN